MKTLFLIVIIIFISTVFIKCNNKTTFISSIYTLKEAGFKVNPGINDSDLIANWKETLQYHDNPIDALYITLGDATRNKPYINFSDDCWHLDLESIEGAGSYVVILENINRISKGDLDFKEIKDYCNDNEDGKAWVSFTFNGDKYKWDLKVDNDWVDGYLFDKIQDLCKKYNKKGRLTFFPEGQAFVISYLTNQEFYKIKNATGLKLEWLKADAGQIYK
ncbi:hypothetical protein ACI6Q2_09840 [Chitinophagaceae bacterium LWZ2-11]